MSIHPYETVHQMRINAERGFNSIGTVATQKVASDALNLGYPSAYQSVYSAFKAPPRFFQERAPVLNTGFWRGNDLQSDYHAIKKQEEDRLALARVRATQLSRVRYCSTPHGRGILPPSILAQRKYANQSNGAYFTSSARRDSNDAPIRTITDAYLYAGGVLRSPAGQRYGQEVLRRRINELDAIQQATQEFGPDGIIRSVSAPSGMTETQLPSVNESSAIELNLLLESVLNALYSAESASAGEIGGDQLTRFTLNDATRALLLIFRTVPTAPSDFAEDLMGKVDTIVNLLNGALDPETESAGMKVESKQIALTLQILFTKLRAYLERMIGGTAVERTETVFNPLTGRSENRRVVTAEQGSNLSAKERVALSKNLVKELGFSKLLKSNDHNAMLKTADRDRLMNAQQAERYEEGDMDDGEDNFPPFDDDEFSRVAGTREDAQHAELAGPRRGDRAGFDRDERVDFGDNQGLVMGPAGAQYEANQYIDEEQAPALNADEEAGAAARERPVRRVIPDEIRGIYDADLGIHDIAVPRALPAPSVDSTVAPAQTSLSRAKEIIPNRSALPRTKAGFEDLAKQLREVGFNIRVSTVGEVSNIRKNFIRRLNL